MIVSPWLMVFVVVSVLALLAFAVLVGDRRPEPLAQAANGAVRDRSDAKKSRRMRRAEVTAMLAARRSARVGGHRWWQSFERDVELGGFKYPPLAIAGWTIVGAIVTSIVVAIAFQSLWGLLVGLARSLRHPLHRLEPREEEAQGVRRAARRTTSTSSQARCGPATATSAR